ncbi:hypothetical protein PFISCL1PPCAC_21641, partial [Pristionchus fissidentatus]
KSDDIIDEKLLAYLVSVILPVGSCCLRIHHSDISQAEVQLASFLTGAAMCLALGVLASSVTACRVQQLQLQ